MPVLQASRRASAAETRVPVDRVAAPSPETSAARLTSTVTVGVDRPDWGSVSTGRCSISSQSASPRRWS